MPHLTVYLPHSHICIHCCIEAGVDYEAVNQTLGPFNDTHRRHCVEVPLIDNTVCESNPYPKDFSVVMTTTNTEVTVVPTRIGVAVDDRLDPECSKRLCSHVATYLKMRTSQYRGHSSLPPNTAFFVILQSGKRKTTHAHEICTCTLLNLKGK